MARSSSSGGPGVLLHPYVICFGSALLIAGLVADWMYYTSSVWQWANFAAWLIAGGLVIALLGVIALVIDFSTGRADRISWVRFAVVAAAALLSLLNIFVHSRDAWTSVVPEGLGLSIAVTILLLIAALGGWRVTSAPAVPTGDRA